MDIIEKIDETLEEATSSDGIDVKGLLNDLRKAENNMKQLASTVNHFKPGKVRADDYVEPIKNAVKKLKGK
jgi:hypothetical protein